MIDKDLYKSKYTAADLETAIGVVLAPYEEGKKAEYDRFWDVAQENGTRQNYIYAFAGRAWTEETFKPKYNIIVSGNATGMFSQNLIRNIPECLRRAGVTFDTSEATVLSSFFSNCSYLEEAPHVNAKNATSIGTMFASCFNLKKASVTFTENKATSYTGIFNGCNALEDFTADGVIDIPLAFSVCSNLSNTSVQSIIDHLKDLTGATAQTLTFHRTVGNNMTAAQKAAITAKNWTLIY